MADKTFICNGALIRMGLMPVQNIVTEESKKGIILNTMYEAARDLALADHPWNFAIHRASLAQEATAPAFGYSYAYQLPTAPYCLRVLGMCAGDTPSLSSVLRPQGSDIDPTLQFVIEGRSLLCNYTTALIKYIKRVEDEGVFSPGFVFAFAARLTAETTNSLTGHSREAALEEYYKTDLPKAKAIDGLEGTPESYDFESNWTGARL